MGSESAHGGYTGDNLVSIGWRSFRAFWTAEEVPRWFGFSLVLVYLAGLGAVGQFGMSKVRTEARDYFRSSSEYAVQSLADRLGDETKGALADSARVSLFQRGLYDLAAHVPVGWVHVIDGTGKIVASTIPSEVGGATTVTPGDLADIEGDGEDRFVRIPIRNGQGSSAKETVAGVAGGDDAESDNEVTAFFLEARLLPELPEASGLARHVGTLTIILVAMGVLFGLFRCLRAQLRGVRHIADRLHFYGDRIDKELASLYIADAADTVTATWNKLIDLTQELRETVNRSQAHEELARVLERSGGGALAEALNALPDGIAFISDEVRFEYANSTANRLFGWDAQQSKQITLPDAQAAGIGGKALDIIRGAQRPDGSFETRAEVVESDESEIVDNSSYRVWVIPLHRAHHAGEALVVIRDVSQQIRAERSREDFVTQVTHELRTPLTNIRAYAETLSSGMFDDPNVITECYNVITKETRRLSRLIEDILSVSQLEVGSIELHLDQVDLKTLLSEGVRDVRGLADEKNIDIQVQLPAKTEPIRGDRDKLAVVLNNLLGNAIKYTPADGDIIVGCQYSADAIVLTIKDNGIGIDPKDHVRVFEKFQRANDPDVMSETGTGIGLYTAREIVRRHGGDIELISQKNEGSTFMVRLPHRESRAAALSTQEEA